MFISSNLIFIVVVITILSFFFFQREHFLIALLLLELISIVLVLGIPLFKASFGLTSTPLVLVLLTISACEASLGLGVMVYLVRSHGNDLLHSISLSGV
jgi:NADH:ubiquinone oxidoreductase subunit K